MATPTLQQYEYLMTKYWEVVDENRELKTVLIEKDETISRLRRTLNNTEHKVAQLEQVLHPNMFLASQ